MKIAFLSKTDDKWQTVLDKLKKEFSEITFLTLNDGERNSLLKEADAVIAGRLINDEILYAEKLKVIFIPFTGLNNFPLELIKQKGIVLSNTHANSPYVAEHAVTLALALLGKVNLYHNDIIKGKWNRDDNEESLWVSMRNKTVGILGFGHIGENIAKLLQPYGCTVYGFKKNVPDKLPSYINEVSNDLKHIIKKSGIIFVCLPLNSETKHILNHQILQEMQGKYIINIGRGETISEEALYNALKNGILKGAALDVWYNYPKNNPEPVYPANFPFWELPNVLLSPHKASQTKEAIDAMINDTYENIRSFIINGIPKQTVKL